MLYNISCFWLSADSPAQKCCLFLRLYTIVYLDVVQGMLVRWGGVGWGGVGWGGVGWGGAHVVNIREHRFDVTLMEHVATLADVVNRGLAQTTRICQRKRVKFNNRFVVAGTQQLDSTVKILNKWKLIAFAQKKQSHGGTKIVGNGREASNGGIMLPSLVE